MPLANYSINIKIVLIFFIILCGFLEKSYAQKTVSEDFIKNNPDLGSLPVLIDKDSSLYVFINNNIRYPLKPLLYNKYSGQVEISFVVTSNGTINNAKIINSIDKSYSKEVFRLLKKTKWKAGKWNGKRVNVRYSMKINIKAPYLTDVNLRQAQVLYNGELLPKNKIWYMADTIYFDQIAILTPAQNQALLGKQIKRPLIVINPDLNIPFNINKLRTIFTKSNGIDTNFCNLFINDALVDINIWKMYLLNNESLYFKVNYSSLIDIKINVKLYSSL